jgi:hypothetical protein
MPCPAFPNDARPARGADRSLLKSTHDLPCPHRGRANQTRLAASPPRIASPRGWMPTAVIFSTLGDLRHPGGGRNPPRAVDSSQPKLPLVLLLSITCEAKRIGETDAYRSYVERYEAPHYEPNHDSSVPPDSIRYHCPFIGRIRLGAGAADSATRIAPATFWRMASRGRSSASTAHFLPATGHPVPRSGRAGRPQRRLWSAGTGAAAAESSGRPATRPATRPSTRSARLPASLWASP